MKIESFPVMNLRGVSTNKKYYTVCFIAMQSYKELDILSVVSRGSSDGFNMVGLTDYLF
jgi:hypothetical protein